VLLIASALATGAQGTGAQRRERASGEVVEAVLRAWRRDRPGEPIAVSVIELKTRDVQRVFPRGLRHLPETLEKFGIYPATREPDAPRWQYLGARTIDGFPLAVFRLMPREKRPARMA
jgi:hypothetical protein